MLERNMAKRKKTKLFLTALLGLAMGVPLIFSASAASEAYYQPKIDFRYKLGNERTLGSTELFFPIKSTKNEMLFLDLRAVVDDNGASEANLGFGHRQVKCCSELGSYIRGAYIFFDRRRSANDNYFSQLTVGAELLSNNWDFRANVYMPFSNGKVVRKVPSSARLAGSSIYVDSGVVNEKALRGYDVEIGYRLFGDSRIYVGGYQFIGGGVPNVTGIRGRLEWDVNEHIQLGLESQYDHVRGNNSYAEVRVSIPFGPDLKEEATGIYKRMTTPIVRDIDVVTQDVVAPDVTTFVVKNKTTGLEQKVFYVDNSVATNGDGTTENPFDNLADAEAAAGIGDVIYVAYGDGTNTNMDAGITLSNDGQKLIGSGVDFAFDTSNFDLNTAALPLVGAAATFIPATTAPEITNIVGDGITVAADNIEVAGINLVKGSVLDYAVAVTNQTGTNLHDLNITGWNQAINAVFNDANSYELDIDNVTTSTQFLYGIKIDALNNTDFTGRISNVALRDATLSNGLTFTSNGAASTSLTVSDSIFYSNNINDIGVFVSGNALQNNVVIKDSFFDGSARGIDVMTSDTSTLNLDVLRNTMSSSTNLYYTHYDTSVINTNIIDNNIESVGAFNTFFILEDAGVNMTAKVQGNTIAGGSFVVGLVSTAADISNIDFGAGTQGSLGQNRIYAGMSKEWFLNVGGGTPVSAENNWWGVDTGLDLANRAALLLGTINAANFLTTDPDL